MKIIVDDEQILNLNETQKKVIMNDILAEEFDADMKRRVRNVINHKYEQCFKRLKAEWEPKLKRMGIDSIPLDDDKFAELVFAQREYKDRSTRAKEEIV